jgi:hypothetical protein
MKARIISILIISFLASSCSLLRYRSLEEEYNKVWTGRSYAEIVEEFGAPDRIVPDGKDGNIAVVDTHFGYFDPDYTTTVSSDKIYKQFFIGVLVFLVAILPAFL